MGDDAGAGTKFGEEARAQTCVEVRGQVERYDGRGAQVRREEIARLEAYAISSTNPPGLKPRAAMNWKRILLGGLAAGVLIDAFEGGLSGLLFGEQFRAEMARLGLGLQVGPGGGLFFVAWGFIIGIVSVWLYAAVRPRLGPGPRTAAIVTPPVASRSVRAGDRDHARRPRHTRGGQRELATPLAQRVAIEPEQPRGA